MWDALCAYRPQLVVIEFNPTIPNEVDFVQPRDLRVRQGSSLTALVRLAATKGYRLIHATAVNGIFVQDHLFERFGISDGRPQELRSDLFCVTWLFETYDGRLHPHGYRRARWHDLPLRERRLQALPRALQRHPDEYTPLQMLAWRLWQAVLEPSRAAARLRGAARRLTGRARRALRSRSRGEAGSSR